MGLGANALLERRREEGRTNDMKKKLPKKANPRPLDAVVSTQTNQLLAQEITERVAKRVQEMEGRYGTTASFNMKATIYDEVFGVLQNGVEC